MFFITFTVDQGMRWNTRGGYAWILQNVPERHLASVNIELAPIGLTTI